MILTDYKFRFIKRIGNTTICRVGFYEGNITTKLEENPATLKRENVTRYRRSKLLLEKDFEFEGTISDDEVRRKMNTELSKDKTRTPIKKQVNAQDIRQTI